MPTLPSLKFSEHSSPSFIPSGATISASSPSASLQEEREEFIRNNPGETDWQRFFASVDSDAPVPYDPNDDDELYDPNDDAVVEASWLEAAREGRVTRGVGKDAVVLTPEDLGFGK